MDLLVQLKFIKWLGHLIVKKLTSLENRLIAFKI